MNLEFCASLLPLFIYLGTRPLGVLAAAVWSALERMCESRGFTLGVEELQ